MTVTNNDKTLRSLYNRAARSFLNRDHVQTHSLIQSAFSILDSFESPSLVDFLRKWDILRITSETTLYSSPSATVPDSIKPLTLKTPQTFVSDLYNRSIQLFAKSNKNQLPAPVLITLVYSSLKLECPEFGRRMIEDWLAKRGDHLQESQLSVVMSQESLSSSVESLPGAGVEENGGYEKVIELYCLQVLPKLEEWEYATEFLEYEPELAIDIREVRQSIVKKQLFSNKTSLSRISSQHSELSMLSICKCSSLHLHHYNYHHNHLHPLLIPRHSTPVLHPLRPRVPLHPLPYPPLQHIQSFLQLRDLSNPVKLRLPVPTGIY